MSVPGVAVSKVEPATTSGRSRCLAPPARSARAPIDLLKREPRALSRRGGERAPQRRGAGEARARARRALRRGRRSGGLCASSRARCPAPASRLAAGEDGVDRGGAAAGRLGDGCDHRRGRAQADAGRRSSAARPSRSPTRNAWSVRAACSCDARRAQARPCCRSIPNTTRCSRRLGRDSREDVRRVILTASGGPFRTWSTRGDQGGDAGAGAQASRTGRWARRSRSIPRR